MALNIEVRIAADEVTATQAGRTVRLPTTVTLRPARWGLFGRRWSVNASTLSPTDGDKVRFAVFSRDTPDQVRLSRSECLSWYFVALLSPLASGFPKRKMDVDVIIARSLLAEFAPSLPPESPTVEPEAFLRQAFVRVARKVRLEAS